MPPKEIIKINEAMWDLPVSYKEGMNVPARIIGTEKLLNAMDDGVFDQVTNVACLPGIVGHSFAMPDCHWGYGAPIGGVAAFDPEIGGVISPGMIGFDINCGMRLVTTNMKWSDVSKKGKELVDILFNAVPSGVGVKGFVKVNNSQFKEIMEQGSKWCIENGYGWKDDLERTESYGKIDWADSSKVTNKARDRGINQIGTLGSGNHYLEVQQVKKENIYDEALAKKFGLFEDQVIIMVHCGSRGFGHQIATDYLRTFEPAMKKYNITIKDRELVCAPFNSNEGQDYYKAMACAANMAFVNRQVILHRIRESFEKVFKQSAESMEMNLVYDVAHNIARYSEFKVNGKKKKLVVHRKGATLSLGPGNKELCPLYQKTGQPVIIGGSMETGSFLMVGTKKAEEETFGSTCHGSGRTMSRTKAKTMIRGDDLQKDMEKRGIIVKSASMSGLAEEWGSAYKDINEVVKSVSIAGISKPVVGLNPKLNIKG